MGKFILAIISAYLAATCLAGTSLTSSEKEQLQREARLVVDLIQNYHASGRLFSELDSSEILNGFINKIDPGNRFLTKGDLEYIHLRFDRTLKAVYLPRGDLQPAFEIYDLFSKRVQDRLAWVDSAVKRGFSFSDDEMFSPDEQPTPDDGDKANAIWGRHLRDELLTELVQGETEAQADAAILRHYNKARRNLRSVDSLAIRELFFDGLLQAFDPHSGYFSADSTKEFNLEMAGTVGGTGLDLKKDNSRCVVAAVSAGSPADLQAEFRPGDVIEAVAEGEAPFTELKGLRLREVVALIRGAENTQVRIAYRRSNDPERRECRLTRTLVVSIDDRARGAVSEIPAQGSPRRIGWIRIPSFYASPEDEKPATSLTADVIELVQQMDPKGLDALVIDLRDNGGGALKEALGLSSLFVPKGLILLTKGLEGKTVEHYAPETAFRYDGPLVILVSGHTASAAEIFAAAMQFHHRAVVMGSPTFGKGSVQNYIDLAKFSKAATEHRSNWGTLRLTSERYFRPDGKAVQNQGVTPDIALPLAQDPGFKREKDLAHALAPEDLPAPADARPSFGIQCVVTEKIVAELSNFSQHSVEEAPDWKLLRDENDWFAHFQEPKPRSLRLETRRAEAIRTEKQLAGLRQRRRELAASTNFASTFVEISPVKAALAAHRAHLAELRGPTGNSVVGCLTKGSLVFLADGGFPRRIWINRFPYSYFTTDSESVVEAFNTAAGTHASAAQMNNVLHLLALQDDLNENAVLEYFRPLTIGCGEPALEKGVEAALLRMIKIEDRLRASGSSMDVPMREAMRTAAHWCELKNQ